MLPLVSQLLSAFTSHFSERHRYCGFNHIPMSCSLNNGNLIFFLISTHYPAKHISFLACHHAEVNTSWHGPNSHALGGQRRHRSLKCWLHNVHKPELVAGTSVPACWDPSGAPLFARRSRRRLATATQWVSLACSDVTPELSCVTSHSSKAGVRARDSCHTTRWAK